MCYAQGIGVVENHATAFEWYMKAAILGFIMFLYKGHRGLATIYISWMVAETKSSCKICNVRKDSAVSYLR